MKKIYYFISAILLLTSVASCNNGSDDIDPEQEQKEQEQKEQEQEDDPEVKREYYTFSFSIKVHDNEGNNLLTTPEEFRDDCYNEQDISLKYANDRDDEVLYSISNENNETLLNITVEGEYLESNPVQEMTVQWVTALATTTDLLKYELEKSEDKIQCKKIWVNDELTWENQNSDLPVFSIVKEKIISYLPPEDPDPLKFAFNLFKKAVLDDLRNNNENTFVSPLSVSIALNMLVNGAEGRTKDEILKTLEAQTLSIEQINEQSKKLSNTLTSVDPDASLSIANSLWSSFDFPIKEDFIQTNINYYDAEVNSIDFTSENAIDIINKWCADKTNNRIPEALTKKPSYETKLMLINALHFKSDWASGYTFNGFNTFEADFHTADGSIETVDMMNKRGSYLYKSDSYAAYLKIPFGNGSFNMVLILPNEDKTMQEVIDNIDHNPSWITSGGMTEEVVLLSLPKFKMEFSYKMKEFILPEMGMNIPFARDANFSKISDKELFVSEVIHKTTIDVNENGAEASAVTIIEGQTGSSGGDRNGINFNVNRPFVFSICEETTGTILFIGKINKISK